MIKTPTVFILGAGASKPFKYPTGKDLVAAICQNITNSNINSDTIRTYAINSIKPSELKRFAHSLSYSGKSSVDAFLEHRTEFIEIGKLAIAQELIKYEDEAVLFQTGDWYQYLYDKLNTSFEAFDNNNISIITFNYDRSFEHYLFTALKHSYGKSDKECADKIKNIPIIHLHGQLGKLPWQDEKGREYANQKDDIGACHTAAAGIRIIHENITGDDAFSQAHILLKRAGRIYFLGFGYNETNIKRLYLPSHIKSHGTAFGLEDAERKMVQAVCRENGHDIILDPSPVLQFLRSKVRFDI